MTKKLFILRHARTEPYSEDGKDFGRSLMMSGMEDATLMGKKLAKAGVKIDHVFCSTATRTQQTLETILPHFGVDAPHVTHSDSLYLASYDELLSQIQELPESYESVMIVGHNPGLHQLVQTLSGSALMKFSPCTLAVLETGNRWSDIDANMMKLTDVLLPS